MIGSFEEKWKAEGIATGRKQGLATGRKQGLAAGWKEGFATGWKEGFATAWTEGLERGRGEVVKRLIELRFGAELAEAVAPRIARITSTHELDDILHYVLGRGPGEGLQAKLGVRQDDSQT